MLGFSCTSFTYQKRLNLYQIIWEKMKKLRNIMLSKWFWLIAGFVLIMSRMATWLFPYDSDHWIFYYIGRRWINGATLYIDMWDHKSPLIYFYNTKLHILFGDNLVLHRIFFTIVALIGIWIFYKTAQILYKQLNLKNKEFIARVATLLFIFFFSLSQFTNSGNNNENLGVLFILLTLYLYLLWRKNLDKQWQLLLSGIFAGFVFFLKANFAILLLPVVIDLIYLNRKNIYKIISSLAMFAFGVLLQLFVWAFYFKEVGTFKQFYIATFEFNSKYIKALGWDLNSPGIVIFIGILVLLIVFFAPFLYQALKQFIKPDKNLNYLLALIAASSVLFMVLAGTFYSHYFLIIIPYLCLMFGATVQEAFKNKRQLKLIFLGLIAVTMLLISYKQLYNTFSGSVAQDATNQKNAAEYITSHSNKDDKIFANVYGATFYELTQRDSGSRFISASHPLIDYKYHFGYDFNVKFIFDMEESQAKYVVMSSDKNDLYRTENPVVMRYINRNYHFEIAVNGYDIYRRN